MTADYSGGRSWGKQSARDILAKKRPRSLDEMVKLRRTLEKHVEKKYSLYAEEWRSAYMAGVDEELTNYSISHAKRLDK